MLVVEIVPVETRKWRIWLTQFHRGLVSGARDLYITESLNRLWSRTPKSEISGAVPPATGHQCDQADRPAARLHELLVLFRVF